MDQGPGGQIGKTGDDKHDIISCFNGTNRLVMIEEKPRKPCHNDAPDGSSHGTYANHRTYRFFGVHAIMVAYTSLCDGLRL